MASRKSEDLINSSGLTQGQARPTVRKENLNYSSVFKNLKPPKKIPHAKQWEEEKNARALVAYETLLFLKETRWADWGNKIHSVRYDLYDALNGPLAKSMTAGYKTTQIIICTQDSFSAALLVLNQLGRTRKKCEIPLVLNMANRFRHGGGFLLGARAQEEDCCRRSDLYLHLEQLKYPLPLIGASYSFPVSILRSEKEKGYKFLREAYGKPPSYYQIGVISAAAYENPDLSDISKYKKLMSEKVWSLLMACYMTGHRTLILSAWGCGAFNNPPELVAQIFREQLRKNFKNKFETVIFALATENPNDGNMVAFLDEFKLPMMCLDSKGL